MSKRDIIVGLLHLGMPYSQIAKEAECAKSSVSYHAEKLGLGKGHLPQYDWSEIQKYHDAGHRRSECERHFGFSHKTWSDAVESGRIRPNDYLIPISELLVVGRNTNRNHLKARLLQEGLLQPKCYNCGITDWRGNPVSLQLHHVDGNGKNNQLENLKLLCPNCHSQTETWGGKNRKMKTRQRERG